MGTKQENEAKREAKVQGMEAQLKAWSTQIDDLVAGYLEAGAQSHDAYRLRIDELRNRHGVAQAKLDDYTGAADHTGMWGAFRSGIKDDWKALESGLKDLTK
jgi:hypothetical protein